MQNENSLAAPLEFDGYGLAFRTFWVSVSGLKVRRAWQRDPWRDDELPFSSWLSGVATATKDGVCIIGKAEERREFDFVLRGDLDANQAWEFEKANDLKLTPLKPAAEKISRLRKLVVSRLDEAPPTAHLGFIASDWEIGNGDSWFIECRVSGEVFEKLAEDVLAGAADTIDVGIKWVAGFVRDQYAPPSVPTAWGMCREADGESPDPLRGHVTSVTWAHLAKAVERTSRVSGGVMPTQSESARESGIELPRPQPVPHEIPKAVVIALWIIATATMLLAIK